MRIVCFSGWRGVHPPKDHTPQGQHPLRKTLNEDNTPKDNTP